MVLLAGAPPCTGVTSSLLVQRRSNQEESTPEWRDPSRFSPHFGARAASTRHPAARGSRTHPCVRPLRGALPKWGEKRARHTGGLTFRTATTTTTALGRQYASLLRHGRL